MEWFDDEKIRELHAKSIERKLEDERDALMGGISKPFVAGIKKADNLSAQLMLDLRALNSENETADGKIPFEVWLNNASHQLRIFPKDEAYFEDLANKVASGEYYREPENLEPSNAESLNRKRRDAPEEQVPLIGDSQKQRRIDGAAPTSATIGDSIDVVIQVLTPDSVHLSLETWPLDGKPDAIVVDSNQTPITFPRNSVTGELLAADLSVSVVAPDFDIEGRSEKELTVPPEGNSKILSFLLTAKRPGRNRRINLEVATSENKHVGTLPFQTTVFETEAPVRNIASVSLGVDVSESNHGGEEPPEKRKGKLPRGLKAIVTGFSVFLTLLAIVLPATQHVREAARRSTNLDQMRILVIGLQNHNEHTEFADELFNDEKLSWRVHILPFIEKESLYKQFRLDEPWDSPHNMKLVDKMPSAFGSPRYKLDKGTTTYFLLNSRSGPDRTAKAYGRDMFNSSFPKSILIVDGGAERADVWTKPTHIEVDTKDPREGLPDKSGEFAVAFCDGVSQYIGREVGDKQLIDWVFPNGNSVRKTKTSSAEIGKLGQPGKQTLSISIPEGASVVDIRAYFANLPFGPGESDRPPTQYTGTQLNGYKNQSGEWSDGFARATLVNIGGEQVSVEFHSWCEGKFGNSRKAKLEVDFEFEDPQMSTQIKTSDFAPIIILANEADANRRFELKFVPKESIERRFADVEVAWRVAVDDSSNLDNTEKNGTWTVGDPSAVEFDLKGVEVDHLGVKWGERGTITSKLEIFVQVGLPENGNSKWLHFDKVIVSPPAPLK